MNTMAHPPFSNKNELSVPYYQGQQQYGDYQGQQQHGPPSGNNQGQNEFPMERDQRRQAGEPAGFATPPVPQTSGVLGDHRYPATGPPIQRVGDYSVCPEEHNRLPPSTGSGSSFSELQQIRPNAVPRQQPMGGTAVTNQMGNPMSQPFIGQNTGYTADHHGRGRSEYYSSAGKEGPMMLQQQPQLTNTPRGGNPQLNMRMGAIPQPVKLGHLGGDMGQNMTMPKIHDHAAYPNVALRGAPQKMFGSDLNIPATDSYCQHHEISVTGDNIPAPFMTFEATGFAPEILREIHAAGFSSPTPIQAQTWPIALQSRDIVAIAKTGSGKTLGYLIPAFMHLKQCRNNPQIGPTVLVLSPTRELATQIQDEAIKFGRSSRISCTCLYGGAPKGPQLREIERGVDIVVATPGRLNDILEMKKINFSQVSFLVLDEADRMLDMGFEPQIRSIVSVIPPRRQTLMYTATWPKEVRKIAGDLLVNPVQVNIGNDELSANKSITQHVEVVLPMEKQRRLEQIIRTQERGSKIIIFCSTKKLCDQLARNLRGYGAAAIHGDKNQSDRDFVLNQFRVGKAPILVATDVAARGLDIKDIRVVINYDFPTGIEDYVHRIGRTGRAGATGVAYTFISDQDCKHAAELVKILEGANQRVPPQVREMAARGASFYRGSRGGGQSRWGDSGGSGRGMRDDMNSRGGGRGMRDDMSSRGGGRWDPGNDSRGMRDGGFGGGRGRNDFASGGRSGRGNRGGRGGFDRGPGGRGWQDREFSNGRGGHFDGPRRTMDRRRDRSYSRSPDRVRTWGYGSSDDSRSRSRSRSWSRSRSRSWSRSRSRSRSRSFDRQPQRVRRASGFDVVPSSAPQLPTMPPGNMTGGAAGAVLPATDPPQQNVTEI